MAPVAESTFLSIAVKRAGTRQGIRAVTFMACWQIVAEDLGHEPTIEEYADWWRDSLRTAYRAQAAFREAFPGETTPRRLLDASAAHWATRSTDRLSPRALQSVPFPA